MFMMMMMMMMCSSYGEDRCLQDFGGEPVEKRPLGRRRTRWEGNIEMCLIELG
jgi:hypothetical protein